MLCRFVQCEGIVYSLPGLGVLASVFLFCITGLLVNRSLKVRQAERSPKELVQIFRSQMTKLSSDQQRPWHCPEILKVVLKCLKFTPCPEFLADVLKFFSTPVNGASVHKHLYQLQGVDAPAHVSLRSNCGP